MLKVTLINHELGFQGSGTLFQGYSGRTYGQSRWDPKWSAQVVQWTGTQAEWQELINDVSRAWRQSMRRWIPFAFESGEAEVVALPPEVQEFLAGYNLAMDGRDLPDTASMVTELGHALVKNRSGLMDKITEPDEAPTPAVTVKAIQPSAPRDDLHPLPENTRYMAIVAAAKRAGVDISGCNSNLERVALVNERRALTSVP